MMTHPHHLPAPLTSEDLHPFASIPSAGGSANITMTYDALGRRVSKSDGVNTTVYVCATHPLDYSPHAGQELAEYAAGAAPSAPNQTYVFGTYIDEPLAKIDAVNGTLYYHANRQFCVTAMTNSAGAVVERYAYSPYGVTTILAPDGVTVRATSSEGNPFLYTGRRLDPEFASSSTQAIYYYRARYYDPEQGRFIGRDPLEYVDGMSLYAGYFASKGLLDASGMTFSLAEHPTPPGNGGTGGVFASTQEAHPWVGSCPEDESLFKVNVILELHLDVRYDITQTNYRMSPNERIHEFVHVFQWKTLWYDAIDAYRAGLGCMCYKTAQCYSGAVALFIGYRRAVVNHAAMAWDCSDYTGQNVLPCAQAQYWQKKAEERRTLFDSKVAECEAME
jgi:RHS repeat-associated protein